MPTVLGSLPGRNTGVFHIKKRKFLIALFNKGVLLMTWLQQLSPIGMGITCTSQRTGAEEEASQIENQLQGPMMERSSMP